MKHSWLSMTAELLLGTTTQQRRRVAQTLICMVLYAAYSVVQVSAAAHGMCDLATSKTLAVLCLGCGVLSYLLVRSGWSERFSADPALTRLQMVAAIVLLMPTYLVSGEGRGVLVSLLPLSLLFGAFGLRSREVFGMGLFALATLLAVAAWGVWVRVPAYDPLVEMYNLAMGAITVIFGAGLALRLTTLNRRLREQKQALKDALENIRLMATRDELTGLSNRRHMLETLEMEDEQLSRGREPYCLALFDLDHFKRINDAHGHGVGDQVLRDFAIAVQVGLRTTDLLARWGGEEFLMLLRCADAGQSLHAVQRVCAITAACELGGLPAGAVTVSAGLAVRRPGEPLGLVIDRADKRLYAAKAAGRNRLVFDPADDPLPVPGSCNPAAAAR
jgi:diguanylate cyclase (GGDEF)-like protein